MYVSHPVRRIGEDPIEGETVALVVSFDASETSAAEVARAIEGTGGEVVAELPFDSVKVRVEQVAVGEVRGIDGLERIETANTISLGGEE